MKTEPCPTCGKMPDRMTINGMRIVCCMPCTSKIGPNGQRSVKAWNEFVLKMRKAIAEAALSPAPSPSAGKNKP